MSNGRGIWIAAALLVGAGYTQVGGPVRNADGTVNPSETLGASVDEAGKILGDGIDSASSAAGRGASSAFYSSKVVQAGAAGAGGYYAYKYRGKFSRNGPDADGDGVPNTTPPATTPPATTPPQPEPEDDEETPPATSPPAAAPERPRMPAIPRPATPDAGPLSGVTAPPLPVPAVG